jgi:hypothetical protein
MDRRTILLALLLSAASAAPAQTRVTLNGFVRDSLSRETLIGASITVQGLGRGVNTNAYGFFSLSLPPGAHVLVVTYVGYAPREVSVVAGTDQRVDIALLPLGSLSQEIVVSSRRRDANVRNTQMGRVDLPMSRIRSLPVIFGEVDPLKTLQLLPGVTTAGEGNSGIYVRGGGPDQNLIMLDDAVVYNTGHLFGFFSVFNGDAIKNTSLIKGGMPAQYGGRLSSVLDISMKDGNMSQFAMDGGIGTIASRFSAQGPIRKDKASFIVSGRRTYIDLLAKPFIPRTSAFYGSGYYFYDMNAKVNWRVSEKDRFYLSGYFGRDVFDFVNGRRSFDIDIPWGNSTLTARWNHVFSPRLFANTTAVYNDYNFSFGARQNDFQIRLQSGIRDYTLKTDFDYYPLAGHRVKFGGQYTFHRFTPSVVSGRQDTTVFSPNNAQLKYAVESALYAQDDWDLGRKLKLNTGLRFSQFSQVGPYRKYSTDPSGNRVDSIPFGRLDPVRTYAGLEPRLTARYTLGEESSLKASVARNFQYIHLVSNSGSTLPTDVWVPSTYRVRPQMSWQYALGYYRNVSDGMYETSIEAYYKTMDNQIEYREGYTPSTRDTEEEFVFGRGWSYGAEFLVDKRRGRLTGWIGYTLAWTWRRFPQLNGGDRFPARYDRRHDLSIVAVYELSRKWKLSGSFVYATGNAITLPERFYVMEGVLTQEYSDINQYRMSPYHRLDLSATYTPPRSGMRKFKGEWVFSIYNAYSRLNPYFLFFEQTGSPFEGNLRVQAKQVSLFPVIPSVTWNFKR